MLAKPVRVRMVRAFFDRGSRDRGAETSSTQPGGTRPGPFDFPGVFWILPLVGARRCLSRVVGLSQIPPRNNKRQN